MKHSSIFWGFSVTEKIFLEDFFCVNLFYIVDTYFNAMCFNTFQDLYIYEHGQKVFSI